MPTLFHYSKKNDQEQDEHGKKSKKKTKKAKREKYLSIFNNILNEEITSPEQNEKWKVKIIHKIADNSGLVRAANKTIKDQQVEELLQRMVEKVALKKVAAGMKTVKAIESLKGVCEVRSGAARLSVKFNDAIAEIVAISDKDNQKEVIEKLKNAGY